MSSAQSLHLGWIGLGSMGLAMALNVQKFLVSNGSAPLRYTNRTMSRGAPLQEMGGVPCATVERLAEYCDVIFISLSDDTALTQTITTLLFTHSLANKIIVDTTTIYPSTSTLVSDQIRAAGGFFISAPVFGATPVAQAGRLLVAVAGPQSAIQTIQPFLDGAIARQVIHVSDDPSKALLLKTTSNFITAGLHYLLSEAHVFAEKSGLPAPVLESLIEENFGAYAHGVSRRLTNGDYCPPVGTKPMSGLELGIKDVGIGVGVAGDLGMKLRVGELILGAMAEAKEWAEDEGKGRELDSTSVFGTVRMKAGLNFESERVNQRDAEGRE